MGESKDISRGIIGNAVCKLKKGDLWEVPSVGPKPTSVTHHRSTKFAVGNVVIRATKLSVNQFRTNLQLSTHRFCLWFSCPSGPA